MSYLYRYMENYVSPIYYVRPLVYKYIEILNWTDKISIDKLCNIC